MKERLGHILNDSWEMAIKSMDFTGRPACSSKGRIRDVLGRIRRIRSEEDVAGFVDRELKAHTPNDWRKAQIFSRFTDELVGRIRIRRFNKEETIRLLTYITWNLPTLEDRFLSGQLQRILNSEGADSEQLMQLFTNSGGGGRGRDRTPTDRKRRDDNRQRHGSRDRHTNTRKMPSKFNKKPWSSFRK